MKFDNTNHISAPVLPIPERLVVIMELHTLDTFVPAVVYNDTKVETSISPNCLDPLDINPPSVDSNDLMWNTNNSGKEFIHK